MLSVKGGKTAEKLIFLIILVYSTLLLVNSSTPIRNEGFNKLQNIISANSDLILEANNHVCNIFLIHHDQNVQSSFDIFETALSKYKQTAPTYNIHLAKLKKNNDTHQMQMLSVRKSSPCALILTIFSSSGDYLEYLRIFGDHVTSDFQGITHKDEHRYIFFISENIFTKVLLSSTLQNIKYKIGIRLKNRIPDMGSMSTMCFYCGAGGRAKIVEVLPSSQKLFPDFSLNGNNHKLRFSCPQTLPFLVEVEKKIEQLGLKRGVFKYVLEFVQEKFNFSFIVVIPRGGSTGILLKDGSWNGVVGDLIQNNADFGIAAANHQRFPLLDFSPSVLYSRITFVTRFPQKHYSWRSLYWPFHCDLWIAILISWIFVLISFWILGKYENRITNIPENLFNRHSIEYMTFVLVGQSINHPLCLATRILCAVWLFSSLVLSTLYSSKLVGILACPLYSKQPQTFHELIAISDHNFKWGMDTSGGALYSFFKSSKNPEFHAIFTGMEPPSEPINCLTRVMRMNFACITWEMMANYAMYKNFSIRQHQNGPLRISKDTALFSSAAITMRPRAVFGASWNKGMRLLMDMGLFTQWEHMDFEKLKKDRSHWLKSQSQSGDTDENKNQNASLLKLSNLKAAFYLLIIGSSFALLCFIWEIVYSRSNFRKTLVVRF